MLQIPNIVSHKLVSLMLEKTDTQASINVLDLPLMPSKLFNCEEAIFKAAAVVKPEMTG